MSAPTPRPTGAIAAIVAAAAVVIAAVIIILTVGLVPLPDLPSLADNPDPTIPGTVAYVHGTYDDACIVVIPAGGGEPRDAWCGSQAPEVIAFTPDGLLVVSGWFESPMHPEGPTLLIIDPQTGAEVDEIRLDSRVPGSWPPDRTRRDDGAMLRTGSRDEGVAELRISVPGSTADSILRLEGPRDYEFMEAQFSPDGSWVLAVDSRGRLLIVGADGAPEARLLAQSDDDPWLATRVAWWIPDDATYTVDPADLADG
jgi:hypothetical protein